MVQSEAASDCLDYGMDSEMTHLRKLSIENASNNENEI